MERDIKRVVIKIGSSTITNDGKFLDAKFIDNIAGQVSRVISHTDLAIVTSGAIVSGRLFVEGLDSSITDKQVAAMYGQSLVMIEWSRAFAAQKVATCQLLLSDADLGARLPLERAMEFGVPIINANDAIDDGELKRLDLAADNDRLAGFAANLIDAETLILLTDVDGLLNEQNQVVDQITNVDEVKYLVKDKDSGISKGGMNSKLTVAWNFVAANSKRNAVIANGRAENVIQRILNGEQVGTRISRFNGVI